MKIIITESQLRLIIENEEYIDPNEKKLDLMDILNELKANENEIREVISYFAKKIVSFAAVKEFLENLRGIKGLINTFDLINVEIAFQIMKGMNIKPSVILEDYMELFDIFKLKPSKSNLIRIVKFDDELVVTTDRTPDLLFKLPNLNVITLIKVGSLENLVEFNGTIKIVRRGITSVSNLVRVGTLNVYHERQMLLPKLREARGLGLMFSGIRDLPSLESVEILNIHNTPLGNKLLETMTEDEIKNKYGVKNILLV